MSYGEVLPSFKDCISTTTFIFLLPTLCLLWSAHCKSEDTQHQCIVRLQSLRLSLVWLWSTLCFLHTVIIPRITRRPRCLVRAVQGGLLCQLCCNSNATEVEAAKRLLRRLLSLGPTYTGLVGDEDCGGVLVKWLPPLCYQPGKCSSLQGYGFIPWLDREWMVLSAAFSQWM